MLSCCSPFITERWAESKWIIRTASSNKLSTINSWACVKKEYWLILRSYFLLKWYVQVIEKQTNWGILLQWMGTIVIGLWDCIHYKARCLKQFSPKLVNNLVYNNFLYKMLLNTFLQVYSLVILAPIFNYLQTKQFKMFLVQRNVFYNSVQIVKLYEGQGSAQEFLSGGQNYCAVCCIRKLVSYIGVYYQCISEIYQNCTGWILEGTGLLNHCWPVWEEPWKAYCPEWLWKRYRPLAILVWKRK